MFAPSSGSSARKARRVPLVACVAIAAIACSLALLAGQGPPSDVAAVQIIVSPSAEEAEQLRAQVNAGADFAALAREKSVDPMGRDGGHLGKLSVASLRPELRDALQGIPQRHRESGRRRPGRSRRAARSGLHAHGSGRAAGDPVESVRESRGADLSNLGQLQKQLKDQIGRDLILLTVVLDPEHDQRQALRDYARV
jgi:hypothetical protein